MLFTCVMAFFSQIFLIFEHVAHGLIWSMPCHAKKVVWLPSVMTMRGTLSLACFTVCNDVEAEPHLLPITNEVMALRSANTSDMTRLDIKASKRFLAAGKNCIF